MTAACTAQAPSKSVWERLAEEEFGNARLGDVRLNRRLVAVGKAFMSTPQGSIPEAAGGWGPAKATYRFMDNPKVSPEGILESHRQRLLSRVRKKPVVLAVADTTELDHTSHERTEGLGPLSSMVRQGFMLHPTLVVTPEREPVGVADMQTWVRNIDEFGKSNETRRLREVSEKESRKWLGSMETAELLQQDVGISTQVVSVFDREGDVFDVLATARLEGHRSQLLVRAQADRRLQHPQQKIWKHMQAQAVAMTVDVEVPRKRGTENRVAQLSLRFDKVTVQPPSDRPKSAGYLPVDVYVVYANEDKPPEGKEPVSWMLLTTVPVESGEDAWKIVQWYSCRWLIEILFKVLKSGCKAEERQLETAERLKRCLAVDLVVAWMVLYLTMIGRETPDLPCTVIFEDYEWKALWTYAHKSKAAVPRSTPTLREATRMIGRLGGHLGRKRDGEPGVLNMWRGLQKLVIAAEMWRALEGPT